MTRMRDVALQWQHILCVTLLECFLFLSRIWHATSLWIKQSDPPPMSSHRPEPHPDTDTDEWARCLDWKLVAYYDQKRRCVKVACSHVRNDAFSATLILLPSSIKMGWVNNGKQDNVYRQMNQRSVIHEWTFRVNDCGDCFFCSCFVVVIEKFELSIVLFDDRCIWLHRCNAPKTLWKFRITHSPGL